MSGVGIIGTIIIGLLAGWIAEKLMARNHGLLMNLVVGVVGSFVGLLIANLLGLQYSGWLPSLAMSTIGAVVLLFIVGLVRGRPSYS